jgi:hypothetical protein
MQHRREQNEILATEQRHFHIRATGQSFVEVHRSVKSGKSATGNDYFSRFHAVTANRNATRVIEILLMDAIIQPFSHLFLKLVTLEISLNFTSTSDSTASLLSWIDI